MQFPRPRRVTLPRLSRRRKLRATQVAALVSVVGTTAVLALPVVVDALRDGSLVVPEPWRTLLTILTTAAATATISYRTRLTGGASDDH